MQLILKRLTAKITESESDQQSSGSVSIDDVVDHDFVPHISGDEAYHVIGHPGADGGVPTEQIARLQMPEDNLICSDMRSTHHKAQIKVSDIPNVLHDLEHSVKVLSLDCFDTLLWRKTATPSDVFAVLAEDPVARRLEITPHQRISAAARAYRAKRLENRSGEIDIGDIYRLFTSLSGEERELLAEAEIRAEMNVCFAFSPFVELIRLAHTRGIKIVIVSDTYLREDELTRLLTRHLPADVMRAISKIYCSVDHGTSKSHGLFRVVIEQCGVPAAQILHIGDNDVADAQAPQKLGLRALHFQPFDREVADFLRLQHAASSLIVFEQPAPEALVLPCYSPFRPLFSVAKLRPYAPETVIGYMSFGPVLYAYARFLMDEVAALQKQGKRVRVLFLLRDAYLLSAACEAYTGKSVGKLVRIRRFVAIAASFKNRADVDYYISGISPEFFNLHSIAKQLLLPPDVTELLIRIARQSDDPRRAFHQSLHDDDVMELILKNSFALRGRMMRYMSKQLGLEEGDTVVLADTGYHGNTHQYLARTFKDEMKVDIMSRYVVASDEPYHAANSKALFTSSWWN
ncbi:MAG: hypothetical protein EOQ48_34040 [Mesorhizobium sp.]|uniref:HAD family hydrolase n=1 Tax=Mesorhizobium sp. TaxID=1871066 RepID=UPI000FE491D0|nr:MAG: hypothetical protein EOQ48_34040 [Mesorhizobium sp.]